jgi:hypothetical protein
MVGERRVAVMWAAWIAIIVAVFASLVVAFEESHPEEPDV